MHKQTQTDRYKLIYRKSRLINVYYKGITFNIYKIKIVQCQSSSQPISILDILICICTSSTSINIKLNVYYVLLKSVRARNHLKPRYFEIAL